MRTLQSNLSSCRTDARAFRVAHRASAKVCKGRPLTKQQSARGSSFGLRAGCSLGRKRQCQQTIIVAKATGSGVATTTEGTVHFSIQQATAFGECVKVVGGGATFGDWNPANAPSLTWGEGNVWSLDVPLPPGEYTFKFVIYREDGSTTWEGGDNRIIEVPVGMTPGAVLETKGGWGETTTTNAVVVQRETGGQEAAAAPSSNGNGNGNGVYSATEAAAAGKEASANGVESENGTADEPERTGTMKVYRPAWPKWGMQDLKAAAAAIVETPAVGESSTVNGTGEADAEAANAAAAGTSTSNSTDSSNGTRTSNGIESTSTSGSSATATLTATSTSNSSAGDTAVAVASLLAAPVVAWSLYTLKSTGCGLPPGPSGLLGAVEGVSYVAVAVGALCAVGRRVRAEPATPLFLASEVLSYATVAAGLVVLVLQVSDYGYIPSPLPDANCFGAPSSPPAVSWNPPPVSLPSASQISSDITATVAQISSTLPSASDVSLGFSQISTSLSQLPASITIELPPGAAQVSDAFIATLSQLPTSVSSNLNQLSSQISHMSESIPQASAELTSEISSEVSKMATSLPDVNAWVSNLRK